MKNLIKALTVVTLFLIAISLNSCTSTSETTNLTGTSTSSKTENSNKNETKSTTISSAEVCQELGSIYDTYLREFDEFRYGPSSTPWQVFYDLSDRASQNLNNLASRIDLYGIDWDSSAIVASLIVGGADMIDEIQYYISQNQFPIGRDLQTIQNDLEASLGSVLSSACR